jgi:hypothetical protein
MAFPQTITISPDTIDRLTALYNTAAAQIIEEIETATNFGTANRQAILRQIADIMDELGAELDDTTRKEIESYYKAGANSAVTQLEAVGADIGVATGFNKIHNEAIAALVDETSAAFAESIRGVSRSTQQLLSQAVKEQITEQLAVGKISGETLRHIKANVVDTLKQQGLTALKSKPYTNKNGTIISRSWSLDDYAEMLIRTKSVEARNRGLANRVAENGYDLVQVSMHGATDVCAKWEGKILSYSGDTPGYPTLQSAIDDGLFHPNCRHAINVLVPELAKLTKAYLPNDQTLPPDEVAKNGGENAVF